MNDELSTYFTGEKNAGLILAGIGLAMLIGAGVLFPERVGLRAFAVTLGVWALLELAIGVGLYVKTGPQSHRLLTELAQDGAAFYGAEQPRMAAVQRNFRIIEAIWLIAIVASASIALWKKEHVAISGVALGMLINCALLLAFDITAERRGKIYFDALNSGQASLARAGVR